MIDLNDLRHSINRALSLGRYTITVGVHGGEQVPEAITLDLIERDDDMFDWERRFQQADEKCHADMKRQMERSSPKGLRDDFAPYFGETINRRASGPTITPEGDALVDTVTDDHGPAVPAQGETVPRIYEFALQDLNSQVFTAIAAKLEEVDLCHARMFNADAVLNADYVHVYDRVTRERRTLKRPEPDAVLTGLRDVAADLRSSARAHGKSEAVRASVEAAIDPMPPVGPLTSTEALKVGDVLRCLDGLRDPELFGRVGGVYILHRIANEGVVVDTEKSPDMSNNVRRFAFVARPGVWMPWEGGENPVPGMMVRVRLRQTGESEHPSKSERWSWGWPTENGAHPGEIIAYMVVDLSPVSSET